MKYVTTNKYSILAERGEQGDSLVQKDESYIEHWKKAVLTPLMSEPAATVIDVADGTTVIPIDIEYQKAFSISTQAGTHYNKWKRAPWTPWFESEDNVLVRTAAIETQVMAYMETIGPTLGYFVNDEDDRVRITQQNINAGLTLTDEWKKAYINSVLSWPIRLEYEVQYTERGEDQLAWA